jgi:uncharacterized cupin superfamily protein
MCAGYPAGKRDAHHFINRGSVPASYLEIGNRIEGDKCFYPDDDLIWCDDGNGEYGAHRDGRRSEKYARGDRAPRGRVLREPVAGFLRLPPVQEEQPS